MYNSPPIDRQCSVPITNHRGPLLCGFNVFVKGLTEKNFHCNTVIVFGHVHMHAYSVVGVGLHHCSKFSTGLGKIRRQRSTTSYELV